MSPLQEKIINLHKQGLGKHEIAEKNKCAPDYVHKVISMFIRNTFPKPRKTGMQKVTCVCPECRIHHEILEPSHIKHSFPPRVYCKEHQSNRYRDAEGF